jgi:hypothetical protein
MLALLVSSELIAVLLFLLVETTEEFPIVFPLVLNQKSAWIVPKKTERESWPPRPRSEDTTRMIQAPLRVALEKIDVHGGVFP